MFDSFSLESCLMKHMNIQFNSMRQENQQQFLQLSKKIDQKHHIESVRYLHSYYLLFDILHFSLQMDLSSFRTPGCNHTSDEPVVCLYIYYIFIYLVII